jgi:hypothetical protein
MGDPLLDGTITRRAAVGRDGPPATRGGRWGRRSRETRAIPERYRRRTLCLAMCEHDPEAEEVKQQAEAIARRLWEVDPKKGFLLLRPAKGLRRFVTKKWAGKSKTDLIAWPGMEGRS